MANGHGGPRTPAHPAPVSGPGAQSRRTDGGPADRQAMRDIPNAAYGEQAAVSEIQGGAPMAAGPPAPQAIPLSAPTQRPDEPVTAGNALGEGVGPEAAGVDTRTVEQRDAEKVNANWLPLMMFIANQPDSSPATREFVRAIRSNLS